MTSSALKPDYTMKLMDVYIHVLIEGCLDIWQDASTYGDPDYRNRFGRTRTFHQGLWSALRLELDSYRPAATLTAHTVLDFFGCEFDYDVDGIRLVGRNAVYRHAAKLYRKGRSYGTLVQLGWKKGRDDDLFVAGADGMPELVPYATLVGRVEEIYDGLVKELVGADTFGEIASQISSLPDLTQHQLDTLVQDIVYFPTPKEAIELLSQAASAVTAHGLEDAAESNADHAQRSEVIRAFWRAMASGFEKRKVHLSGAHEARVLKITESVGV